MNDLDYLPNNVQIVSKNESVTKVYRFENRDIYDIIGTILDIPDFPSMKSFYVVDLGEIYRKYKQWIEHLPNIFPYYAVKSNPDPMILNVLAKLGCGFDCASRAEILAAIEALELSGNSVKPSDESESSTGVGAGLPKILYANPCKDGDSLKFSRLRDIDYLTFDSQCELEKINLYHRFATNILRIKVDDSHSECKMGIKFGCSYEEAIELLEKAKSMEINVAGVSFHVGSNCRSANSFRKAISDARRVFDIAIGMGFNMNILDIGGGFPGTDSSNPDVPTFEQIAKEINTAITEYFGDMPDIRVIAEPGRFMCTTSHTLVLEVIGYKPTKLPNGEKKYIYTVGESIYSSFNCIGYDHCVPVIEPFNERNEHKTYLSQIVGHTCDGTDIIADNIHLPILLTEEKCLVRNFGAYTRASSSAFNGFAPVPAIYVIT